MNDRASYAKKLYLPTGLDVVLELIKKILSEDDSLSFSLTLSLSLYLSV